VQQIPYVLVGPAIQTCAWVFYAFFLYQKCVLMGHIASALVDQINQVIAQGLPQAQDSGFCVTHADAQQVRCVLAYHPDQTRPGNTLSGPTMMMLADAAMYALVLANDLSQIMSVTHDFSIHFLARPVPQDLIAVATLLRAGRRSMVMRVDLYSGDILVAHATGSYARVEPRVPSCP
jgi:uncharacterized protein (TIGR00369 family)